MNKKIDDLTASIEVRDVRINELEQQVNSMEKDLDGLKQYSRRTNLQFQGITDIVNNQIGLTPPPETNETIRMRGKLMGNNCRVFINDDLTARLSELVFQLFLFQDYNQPKPMCTYTLMGTCDC